MNKRIRKKKQRRFDELIQEINIYFLVTNGDDGMLYSPSSLPQITKKAIKRYKRKQRKFDPVLDY